MAALFDSEMFAKFCLISSMAAEFIFLAGAAVGVEEAVVFFAVRVLFAAVVVFFVWLGRDAVVLGDVVFTFWGGVFFLEEFVGVCDGAFIVENGCCDERATIA